MAKGLSDDVQLALPFPPTVNHIWQSAGKKRYLSDDYKAFLWQVLVAVKRAKARSFGASRLSVGIVLCAPNRRKYDIDNRVKATLDALVRAEMMDDDEQVDELYVFRGDIVPGGSCQVRIGEM